MKTRKHCLKEKFISQDSLSVSSYVYNENNRRYFTTLLYPAQFPLNTQQMNKHRTSGFYLIQYFINIKCRQGIVNGKRRFCCIQIMMKIPWGNCGPNLLLRKKIYVTNNARIFENIHLMIIYHICCLIGNVHFFIFFLLFLGWFM